MVSPEVSLVYYSHYNAYQQEENVPELVEELRVNCTLRHFTVRPNLNQYRNTMTGLIKASDFA